MEGDGKEENNAKGRVLAEGGVTNRAPGGGDATTT